MKISVAIISGLLAAGLSCPISAADQGTYGSFTDLITAFDQAQPASPAAVERLLGDALQCKASDPVSGRTDCEAHNLDIAGVRIGFVDYRGTLEYGRIIILGDLGGQCVPIADLKKQFGPGFEHQACTDGAVCLYQSFKRSWGMLHAGLGKDLAATCAKAITFNLVSR